MATTVFIRKPKRKFKQAFATPQRPLLDDEFADAAPPEASSFAELTQRPNAVLRDGGAQVLRGLMLPLCPSANRYWTLGMLPKKGSRFPLTLVSARHMYQQIRSLQFPSSDAKDYVKTLTEYAIQKGFRFQLEGDLRMEVVVCPRNRSEIDVHNYTKVLLDAFQQIGVYVDDSQVRDLRVRQGAIIKGGRLIVSLWKTQHDSDAVLKEAWG